MVTHPIRVYLVDDHHVVRRGMKMFLESYSDIHVVGDAPNAELALRDIPILQPDVVVMDLLLPGGMDGMEATRQSLLACPSARVVVLTAYVDELRAAAALRNGATGYVRKDARPEYLLEVIRAASRGDTMIDPGLAPARPGEAAQIPVEDLSARELEVLRMIARGSSNREIAETLVLGEETVKSHVSSILAKLGLNNRSQAVYYALRTGLIRFDEV